MNAAAVVHIVDADEAGVRARAVFPARHGMRRIDVNNFLAGAVYRAGHHDHRLAWSRLEVPRVSRRSPTRGAATGSAGTISVLALRDT